MGRDRRAAYWPVGGREVLVDFSEEQELSALEYRRYAATIGSELRDTPKTKHVARLIDDMKQSTLSDQWDMAFLGGHREVNFQIDKKQLYGRFEPIAETWLRKKTQTPIGNHLQLTYNHQQYLNLSKQIQ